jgi:hypothetical protein
MWRTKGGPATGALVYESVRAFLIESMDPVVDSFVFMFHLGRNVGRAAPLCDFVQGQKAFTGARMLRIDGACAQIRNAEAPSFMVDCEHFVLLVLDMLRKTRKNNQLTSFTSPLRFSK